MLQKGEVRPAHIRREAQREDEAVEWLSERLDKLSGHIDGGLLEAAGGGVPQGLCHLREGQGARAARTHLQAA